jgi:glycosyl transferase family 25
MNAGFNAQVFTQVLNMDRSTARLATINALLKTAGVDYQRFTPIDGAALDMTDPVVTAMFDHDGWVRGHNRNPTRADIGCYLSHYRALEAFLEQNKLFGLIFEDDAAIPADFVEKVSFALDDATAWDLLKLHARHPGPLILRRAYRNDVTLCSFLVRHAGGAAYIVSRTAAEKMLKHMKPARRMIDWTYDEGHRMNLRVRTLSPMIVGLQAVPTTRDTGMDRKRSWIERQTDRPLLARWALPFRRFGDDAYRLLFNLIGDGGLRAMLLGPDQPSTNRPHTA